MASGFNNIQHSLDTVGCNIQNAITRQGYENQLAITGQTNVLQNNLTNGFNNVIQSNQAQTQALAAKIDLQTQIINDKFCQLEMREMQNTIQQLREEKQALATSAITQQQTQNIVSQLAPKAPIPAYVVQNPGCCYTPTVRVANECGCACGTTNAVL
nr:MAG TPA: hypothetical protein [Caudoviricetes sp.]